MSAHQLWSAGIVRPLSLVGPATVLALELEWGSCTPCACANNGAACTGKMDWWALTACNPTSGYQYTFDQPSCSDMGGYTPASYSTLVAPASCTPPGGALQGSVMATNAVTVCCP